MTILQSFVDSVGDLIGTSKLAKLNRSVFNPVLGTDITREEYNQIGNHDEWIQMPESLSKTKEFIKTKTDLDNAGGMQERQIMARKLLGEMTDQGVKFSESRLSTFVCNLQSERGENPIAHVTNRQLSDQGSLRISNKLNMQY